MLIQRGRDALAEHEKEYKTILENNELMKESKKNRNTDPQGKKTKRERRVDTIDEKEEEELSRSEEEEFNNDDKSE